MIRPDIGGLHSTIPILTVGDGITGQIRHEPHMPHTTARVLNEPESWIEFCNQPMHMNVHTVAKVSVLGFRFEFAVPCLVSVIEYCRY